MASKKTHSHLIRLQIPDNENRRDFLREAARVAREQWDQAHPNQIKNKGGRPSSKEKVFETTKTVFFEWRAKKRRNKLTLDYLVKKVANQNKLSEKTANKFVKDWLINARYCWLQLLPFQVAVHHFTKNPDSYLIFAIGSLLRGGPLRQQTSPKPVWLCCIDQQPKQVTKRIISDRIIPLLNHLPEFLKKFQTLWSAGDPLAKFIVAYVQGFCARLPSNEPKRQLFIKTLWRSIHQEVNKEFFIDCDINIIDRIAASAIEKDAELFGDE